MSKASNRAAGRARLAKAAAKAKASKAAKAAKAETPTATRVKVARPGSKMEKAVLVMEELFVKQAASRKDCVAALIRDAGLTPAGAATYYQLIRTRILRDEQ